MDNKTYKYEEELMTLILLENETSLLTLDIELLEAEYTSGLGGQIVFTDIKFYGANLCMQRSVREHVDILDSWGFDTWDYGSHGSISVLTEDMQRIIVQSVTNRMEA